MSLSTKHTPLCVQVRPRVNERWIPIDPVGPGFWRGRNQSAALSEREQKTHTRKDVNFLVDGRWGREAHASSNGRG